MLIDPPCTGGDAVYIFGGAGVTPDDVDEQDPEPLTTAMVEPDVTTGLPTYRAAFLPAGDYTVALTCQASDDDPAADNTLTFVGSADVTVTAGEDTTHNF